MTDFIVGSDHSGGKDQECINKICETLQKAGHNAESIGVNSNLESTIRAKGKGKTAIFMVNGVCIGTFDSHMQVVKSGLCNYVWFALPQSISPSNDWLSEESCKSRKVPIAHDDNFTPAERRAELDGKYTIDEYCREYGSYVGYACAPDCESVAQKIMEGGSGGIGGTSMASGSDSKKEPTPMSYKDMILDLISIWDGDVECKIRGDTIYINKVPEPKPQLWVIDGTNVVSGQAKVKDYNSDTINTLNVTYDEGKHNITITDEYLINRFGEVPYELKAEKVVTDYTGDSAQAETDAAAGGGAEASAWADVAGILQKYFDKPSDGWDNHIRAITNAKKYDPDIKNAINTLTRKSAYSMKSYIDIGRELQKAIGLGY